MISDNTYYFLFPNTRYAIKAEGCCIKAGFSHVVVPVPRELTSTCGISLKIDECIDEVEQVFTCNEIIYEKHKINRGIDGN